MTMKALHYLRQYLSVFLMFLLCLSSFAQDDQEGTSGNLDYLTADQKQLLKDQQKLLDETREIFKNNLTPDQLALLNDRSISQERRTAMLRNSLTSAQRDAIRSNRSLIRSKKNMFRRSLTNKQRLKLRRFIKKRPLNDRKRLVRRLRRLIQNNMD